MTNVKTMNTDEMATILTTAVICAAGSIATITMVVTYIVQRRSEIGSQNQTGGEDDVMVALETSETESEMERLNECHTNGVEITICNGDTEVDDEQSDNENWLADWATMLIEPILNAVNNMKMAVMG